MNFGTEVDEFDYDKFCNWVNGPVDSTGGYQPKHDTLVTEGIFAPWCMYKEDFLAVGGHDELFAPQSKEDSDLFNRFIQSGYKVLQTWEGLVYHFTSRGSRFNKHAGGSAGNDSKEWQYTNHKNTRNFVRKWGHFVKHDPLMKPIIPPKYDIAFKVTNNNIELLKFLEPWCSVYYGDGVWMQYDFYIQTEQPTTIINLKDKIKPNDSTLYDFNHGIIVEIDGKTFTQQDADFIQVLSEVIEEGGEIGEFELGNMKIFINDLKTKTYGI